MISQMKEWVLKFFIITQTIVIALELIDGFIQSKLFYQWMVIENEFTFYELWLIHCIRFVLLCVELISLIDFFFTHSNKNTAPRKNHVTLCTVVCHWVFVYSSDWMGNKSLFRYFLQTCHFESGQNFQDYPKIIFHLWFIRMYWFYLQIGGWFISSLISWITDFTSSGWEGSAPATTTDGSFFFDRVI